MNQLSLIPADSSKGRHSNKEISMRKPPINVVGPAIAAVLFSFAACLAADSLSASPTKETYLRIADEVDANLQKEILQKFFPVTVDQQGGGFHENYALDWARAPGSNKSIVYQSRLTWTSAE